MHSAHFSLLPAAIILCAARKGVDAIPMRHRVCLPQLSKQNLDALGDFKNVAIVFVAGYPHCPCEGDPNISAVGYTGPSDSHRRTDNDEKIQQNIYRTRQKRGLRLLRMVVCVFECVCVSLMHTLPSATLLVLVSRSLL